MTRTVTSRSRPVEHLDTDVWDLACARTEEALDRYDQIAVSFSGGKDSTVTLQVVRHVIAEHPGRWDHHLPIRTIFYDEEAIPIETEQYVRRMGQHDDIDLVWLCLPVKHRNACSRKSPHWWPWAPEAEPLWCRPLPPEAVQTLPGWPVEPPEARLSVPETTRFLFDPARGNAGLFMGIRAAESLSRHRMLTKTGITSDYTNWIKAGFDLVDKIYPVYDWTTADVWTAPARFGWDYNRAYDHMEMLGLGHHQQRCSPAFGEEPLEKLHTYAACFPDVWDRMVDRVPGVGAAVRYARTELYGYGSKPPLPDGMTWPEHVAHFVGKHPKKEAAFIAHRLRRELRLHYTATACPILPYAEHPDSGCSWEFLLTLAMRGDFKGRKSAGANRSTNEEQRAKQTDAYARDLYALYAEHRPDRLQAILGHPHPLPADPGLLLDWA